MHAKDFILHQHVPQDKSSFGPKQPKKHKWMTSLPNEESLFQTFTTKEKTSTLLNQINRRLKLAGMDVASLDEKYHGVTDRMVAIVDLEGMCLWMNREGTNIFGNCMGRKIRDEMMSLNTNVSELAAKYKLMHDSLLDSMEMDVRMLNYQSELNWKIRYERIDTLKGTPFAYLCLSKFSPIQEHVKAKPKDKRGVIEQTFVDHGLSIVDVVGPYVDAETPVFCVNLIGRVLWMNSSFQHMYNRSDKDLLEIFSPLYGFDRFEKGAEYVLQVFPKIYEFSGVEYKRIDGTNGKPMGYVVIFNTTELWHPEKSKKEVSEEILWRVGLSTLALDEQCKWVNMGCLILGLGGCILYMNDVFRKIAERNDSHLMSHWTWEVKQINSQVGETLDTIFVELPEKYIFLAEIYFSTINKPQRKTKLEFIRIDKDGVPYAYQCWMDFII